MGESMNMCVRTRSAGVDYGFLGSAPTDHWWQRYDRTIDSTKHGAAVESADGMWRIYLTGIPSQRRDQAGRRIRYTLVLDGKATDEFTTGQAMRVLWNWLLSAADPARNSLSAALDGQFDEEAVAPLLRRRDDEAAALAARKLDEAVAVLPREDLGKPAARPALYARWLGDIHRPDARAAWLDRAAGMLGGQSGTALIVNLAECEADLDDVPDGPLTVLLTDPYPSLVSTFNELKPKATAGANDPKAGSARRLPLGGMISGKRTPIVIVAAVLVCLAIWIIRSIIN
jgi:hypothetical protein